MIAINESVILDAIENIIESDLTVRSFNPEIVRTEVISSDNSRSRWVCVVPGELSYYPVGSNMGFRYDPIVFVQAITHMTGRQTEIELNNLVSAIINAIDRDKGLNNTVAHILGYNVAKSFNTKNESQFKQEAIITISCEGRL